MIDSTVISECAKSYPGVGIAILFVAGAARVVVSTVRAAAPLAFVLRRESRSIGTCPKHEDQVALLARIDERLDGIHESQKNLSDKIEKGFDEAWERLRSVEHIAAVLEARK